MALTRFGFIVSGRGLDPKRDRMVMASASFSMIVVGVPHPRDGVAVARALLEEGVQLLELCGGFGPTWTAQILDAVEHRIPVGAVAYGPESIDAMHALFAEPAS